ncbi:hypothetical protein LOAG_11733 [Loa loa]|uniref:Acyl-CoA dehydrogenase/oxidase N-terminal domain-containing protein n=1 Tax=Loa loa TaxID=7209 RepID=A0A1S0TMK2_LOALO|nr:hypothetical protein LOAG_11733 [Loa loa]EFO16771.1 hypothetical protein LOAG_11733 [Loa loa]
MAANLSKVTSRLSQHSIYGPRHLQFRQLLGKFIDKSINPYVDEWEAQKHFPAHNLFKELGLLGIFGVNKPAGYGGLGLDFSYSIAIAEELGRINCAAIPMAIAVQVSIFVFLVFF